MKIKGNKVIKMLSVSRKIITTIMIIILLAAYISVEAKSGDDFLGSEQFRISPLLECSPPSLPFDGDVNKVISKAPLTFTENLGQLENENVRFYAQGGDIWFTDDGVWFEIREYTETRGPGSEVKDQDAEMPWDPMVELELPKPVPYKRVIIKQEFMSANLVRPIGRKQLRWYSNFFFGNDSSRWRTQVPNYHEIYYENIYDDIDLRYYMNTQGLKYDFIIHPGADLNQIKVKYGGAEALGIDDNGNLMRNKPRIIKKG